MSKKSAKNQLDELSAALDDPAALSDALEYLEVRRGVADRFAHVFSTMTNTQAAEFLGVSTRSVTNYANGVRPPDVAALERIARAGWNINWLLTGEGPERLEAAFQSQSQDLSGEHLMIAHELADEAMKGLWLPKPRYFDLVALIYDGLSQGLPYAQILDFARPAASRLAKEQGNDSGQGVAGTGGAAAG